MWIETVLNVAIGVVLLWLSVEDIKSKKVSILKLCLFVPIGIVRLFIEIKLSCFQIIGGFLLGILVIFLSYITHEKIGLADGLCLTFLGFILGFTKVFLVFVLALFFAACISAGMLFFKKVKWKTEIPFLPFLFLGYVSVMLW